MGMNSVVTRNFARLKEQQNRKTQTNIAAKDIDMMILFLYAFNFMGSRQL